MIRYQHDSMKGRSVAVFPSGTAVTVRATRARRYPRLQGTAPATTGAYEALAARLAGRARRVADLGCGAGEGAGVLAASGYEVVGYDDASEALEFARCLTPGAGFVQSDVHEVDVAGFDALVLVDVLGLVADDEVLLRGLARRAPAGQLLVGAVARADVCRTLEAPCRRNYSPEQLDALLVRSGWTQPVLVAVTDELLVFESARAASLEVSSLLRAVERKRGSAPDALIAQLAERVPGAACAAEARELLLTLGDVMLARGEVSAAEEAFTSANALAPACARPFVALARAALSRGAQDDAEALADHALGLDPTDVDAWKLLAGAFVDRGEIERGTEALECAATLAPADAELASRLSTLLADAGDLEGATRALERPLAYGGSAKMHAAYGWLAASAQRGAGVARPSTGRYARVDTHADPGPAAHVLAS